MRTILALGAFAMVAFWVSAAHAEADNNQCGAWMEQYNLVPYRSWGSTPDNVQQTWTASDCNHRVCQYMADKYKVVPYKTWGSLPGNLQEVWATPEVDCNNHVKVAASTPPDAPAKVTVYADPNYKGESKELNGGTSLFNVPKGHKHPGARFFIESLKVAPGSYAVVRLEGGPRLLVKENEPDLFNGVFLPEKGSPKAVPSSVRPTFIAAARKKIVSVRVGTFTTTPDAKVITIVGTNAKYTPDELRAYLQKNKKTLVKTHELDTGECTIAYMNGSRTDLSADAGLLACNVKLADGSVALQSVAVYGGCDLAARGDRVPGGCEVGVVKTTLTLKTPGGGSIGLTVKGPNANSCGGISEQGACMGSGAELAGVSTTVTDPLGNSAGVGVGVGVAFGGGATLDDGQFGVNANIKLGIGMNVNFGVNYKKTGKAIVSLGSTAYAKIGPNVIASPLMAGNFAQDAAFKGATVAKDGIAGVWKDGSNWSVSVAKDAGKGVETVGTKTWKGLVTVGEDFGDFFDDIF